MTIWREIDMEESRSEMNAIGIGEDEWLNIFVSNFWGLIFYYCFKKDLVKFDKFDEWL